MDARQHAETASRLLYENSETMTGSEIIAPVATAHALTALALIATQDNGGIPVVLPYPINIQR